MCLIGYVVLMIVALALCVPLLLIPSRRRLGFQLCFAILTSLPGVIIFQFAVGLILALPLLAILGFYAAFKPTDWVQWLVGVPTIFVIFVSLAAGSLWGCYTGARVGWKIAGGTPLKTAVKEQKVARLVSLWFGRKA
jgi:hypothetical protein